MAREKYLVGREKYSLSVRRICLMASETATFPELEQGIEIQGIERVSPQNRSHLRIFDNYTMWFSCNLVIATFALGVLAKNIFELGFWDSVIAIILFNILGALPVAFFSTLGPRLGLRQMIISRFSFGWVGAAIMALFNVAACIGWSAVNIIVSGQLIEALSRGAIPRQVGILAIAMLTTLVSIYGYRYIHLYQRYAWIPMAVAFFLLLIAAAPHLSLAPTPILNMTEVASFFSFGGAIYGYSAGWSTYAADYNVKQRETTPARRVFWLTFLGVTIPCIVLEIFGVLVASSYKGQSGIDLLKAAASSSDTIGIFLLLVLSLSAIANNLPNDYSLALSMQVLGKSFQRLSREVWTLIGAIVYVLVAVAAGPDFNETLSNYLLLIAYWLGPWSIILTLEHFVFRRGRYNVDDWNTPSRLPVGWAALVSLLIGLGGVLLGAAQVYYVGPIALWLSRPFGMDIGFELGLVFSGVAYYFLRRIELAQTNR
jgi:NCS1 nucleoside transporter family